MFAKINSTELSISDTNTNSDHSTNFAHFSCKSYEGYCIEALRFMQILNSSLQTIARLLINKPQIVNQKDAKGRTIFHHIVLSCLNTNFTHLTSVLDLLFKFQPVDLTLADESGDTALHLVAKRCNSSNVGHVFIHLLKNVGYVFMYLLKKAQLQKFDFNVSNVDGFRILDLLINRPNDSEAMPLNTPMSDTSKMFSKINLDSSSLEGIALLSQALININVPLALLLIEAGVNPFIRFETLRPLEIIDGYIKKYSSFENDDSDDDEVVNLIEHLNTIKSCIMNKASIAEVRKNSRIIACLSRQHRMFQLLPDEILVKIAAETRNAFHTESEAHSIASINLGKP